MHSASTTQQLQATVSSEFSAPPLPCNESTQLETGLAQMTKTKPLNDFPPQSGSRGSDDKRNSTYNSPLKGADFVNTVYYPHSNMCSKPKHSSLAADGPIPLKSCQMGIEVRQPCKTSQPLSCSHGTAFPIKPGPPQYPPNSIGSDPLEHYQMNQHYTESADLLLLANCCATFKNGIHESPFITTTRVSTGMISSDSNQTHVNSQPTQECCMAANILPAVSRIQNPSIYCQRYQIGQEQYNQCATTILHPVGAVDVPTKQISAVSEMETQVSSSAYPIESIQATMFSEEPYRIHLCDDIPSNNNINGSSSS